MKVEAPGSVRQPDERRAALRSLLPWLVLGTVGVVLILLGLAFDALGHASHPDRHEDVLTLANPAHACLAVGGVAVVAGVIGSTWRTLRTITGLRPLAGAYLVAMVVTVAVTGAAVAWLARMESRSGGDDGPGFSAEHLEASPDCQATPTQRELAARLVDDTRAGAARFQSIDAAAREGYRTASSPPLATDHYVNGTYATDGRVLDPAHPEALMYTLTSRGPVLVGVMYLMNSSGEPGIEVGGCLTRWHVHDNLCYAQDTLAITGLTSAAGQCPTGSVHLLPPAALHVWFFDVPGGSFATEVDPAWLSTRLEP